MADRRRYTGTKTLQTGWTGVVVLVASVLAVAGSNSPLVVVAGAGGIWVVGLVVLGVRDRRHWRQLKAASSFDSGLQADTSDLQKIIFGQSVSVSTDVPGLLSQAHLIVRANVEGVDASFTIRIEDADSADEEGMTTGDERLDERFVIRGKEGNVAAVLSDEVRDRLVDLETPGVFTITAAEVTYEIPFTNLSADELDGAGEAAAAIAGQLEAVGRDRAPASENT